MEQVKRNKYCFVCLIISLIIMSLTLTRYNCIKIYYKYAQEQLYQLEMQQTLSSGALTVVRLWLYQMPALDPIHAFGALLLVMKSMGSISNFFASFETFKIN